MTEPMRVILEVGKKRRVVAAAMDWPGLDRWGTSEEDALRRLSAYLPRYEGVAARAGLAADFARQRAIDVIERTPGSSSTDFWGIAHVPAQVERDVLTDSDLERRLRLLRAAWSHFDAVTERVAGDLLSSGRSGGRDRATIIRHVIANEPGQFSRKIEVRTQIDEVLTPDGLARHRQAYVAAIRAYNADARPARTWPIQFLIRRTAQHVLDHAWEMEDRDPAA